MNIMKVKKSLQYVKKEKIFEYEFILYEDCSVELNILPRADDLWVHQDDILDTYGVA